MPPSQNLDLLYDVVPRSQKKNSALLLYQNQLNTNNNNHHYLVIRPRMSDANVYAIGTQVSVQIGTQILTRWISAGTSFLGQEPAEAFFGFGSATKVDRITLSWPDGQETTILDFPANRVQTIILR